MLGLESSFAGSNPPRKRGLSDHTNSLARQGWAKRKEFKHPAPEDLCQVQQLLNNQPR